MNKEKLEYCLIGYAEGNKLYAELEKQILKVTWKGIVSKNAAMELLLIAKEVIQDGLCKKVVLEHKKFQGFSLDAKIWVRNSLLKDLSPKVREKLIYFLPYSISTEDFPGSEGMNFN